MSQQQFSNHKRIHPFYHYFLLPLLLGGVVYSAIHFAGSIGGDYQLPLLLLLAFVLLFGAVALIRLYALKLQDRLIRQEENFRHHLLTGKPLDGRLRTGQIVALRFASDTEFPSLAQRAVEENLAPKQIKQSIQAWRADHRRI